MTQPALFDIDMSSVAPDDPSDAVAPFDERCYRVMVSGPQVGAGGCGVSLWFDDEDEARAAMESAMTEWPGKKVARLELRTVRVTGPRKGDRELVGFKPLWVRAFNPEVRS